MSSARNGSRRCPANTYPLWPGVVPSDLYGKYGGLRLACCRTHAGFFVGVTLIACIAMAWFLFKERKRMHLLMKISIALILAGALGNFDRPGFFWGTCGTCSTW